MGKKQQSKLSKTFRNKGDEKMSDGYCDDEVSWENGMIGKSTTAWKHYPVNETWKRLQAATFVSIFLKNVKLVNQYGPVKGNLFVFTISDSGQGKSPIIKALRRLFLMYNRKLLLPAKFTVPGLTEEMTGRTGKKENGRELEDIEARREGIIVRDEASKLISEQNQKCYDDLFAFLCEIWDGWLEESRTRTFGTEGNVEVYVSLCAGSNRQFLKKMQTDEFWTIGLGARMLFQFNIEVPFGMLSNDFFDTGKDIECNENKAYEEIITMGQKLETLNIKLTMLNPSAEIKWKEYELKRRNEYRAERDDIRKAQLAKTAQNVLKLSLVYAASRLNVHQGVLIISLEDMERAINDVDDCFNNVNKIINVWRKTQNEKNVSNESKMSVAWQHLAEWMPWIANLKDKMCSIPEVRGHFGVANADDVKKVLTLATDCKYLEEICNQADYREVLTEEQVKRFKPARGICPSVYRTTEQGLDWVKKQCVQ